MRRYIYILSALFILQSSWCFGLEISFRDEAQISTNHVTLGDVAAFSDNNDVTDALSVKIIAASPEPGKSSYLDSREIIKNILRKTKLSSSTLWSGSASVKIIRLGQKISQDQLIEQITNYLKNQTSGMPKADISFEPSSLPLPFMIPKGETSWEVIPSNPTILKSNRFSIIIRVDGRVRKNISIAGRVKALAPIAVAVTSLKRGSILTPDNTALVVKDIVEHRAPCLSLREILGKRVKHNFRAGSVIESDDVEMPPLVKKGQLVKIILNHGPLFLSASGIARMSGTLNQVIRVQNVNSRKLIFCRITAPGIVEVII